jgi:hypothetical protein
MLAMLDGNEPRACEACELGSNPRASTICRCSLVAKAAVSKTVIAGSSPATLANQWMMAFGQLSTPSSGRPSGRPFSFLGLLQQFKQI